MNYLPAYQPNISIKEARRKLRTIDLGRWEAILNWKMQVPRCPFSCCDDLFEQWAGWGKRLYVGREEDYEQAVTEARKVREEVRRTREFIDELRKSGLNERLCVA